MDMDVNQRRCRRDATEQMINEKYANASRSFCECAGNDEANTTGCVSKR